MPEEYARVLAAARAAGLRVEALDMSMAARDAFWDACIRSRSDDACDDAQTQARDDHMAARLRALLSRPETGRVLAWTGAWHACRLEQAATLRRAGFPSRSYYVAARGEYDSASGIVRYLDAAGALGWGDRRLLIDTAGTQTCFDGIVALPGAAAFATRRTP